VDRVTKTLLFAIAFGVWAVFANLCIEGDENELARWRLGMIESKLGNIERYLSDADFRARFPSATRSQRER
jgi:hypothetical protein